MKTALRTTSAALAAALLLSGCAVTGGDGGPSSTPTHTADARPLTELELYPDPRVVTGSVVAATPSHAIDAIAENPAQTLPATVVSHDPAGDVDVTIRTTDRVLALDMAGSLAATVWGLGLGDVLVGRDMTTSFPGTEDLPVVTTGSHTINAERVLDLRPDVVITDGSIGPREVFVQLRDSGVAVVFVSDDPSFEGAANMAREVGAVLGVPEVGEQLAERITSEVDAKIAEIAEIAPTDPEKKLRIAFLYLRGASGIYYLFGSESGADKLIAALGARDVAGETGWEGMRPVTDEAMLEADPDVILVMTHGIESTGGVDGLLAAKPAIALTAAGKNERFVEMADDEILSFGPNAAAVLDALARALYAKP